MRARTAAVAGAAVLGAAAVHAGPVTTSIGVVRRRFFPALAGIGRNDHVALTFDDGPDPASTPQFLAALDGLGYRATFFLLGDMVEKAPSLAAEIVAAGHEVAVHGYRHKSHLERTPTAVRDDIARAFDVIVTATDVVPAWHRPPYGAISFGTLRAAARLNLRVILWTTWGRDWRAEATPASVFADVDRGLAPAGTVLLHDSDCTSAPGAWKSALDALPALADRFSALGVAVGPLSDHF